jgi:hypothetical protein
MKFKILTFGLLSLSGFLTFGFSLPRPASAQCVQTDLAFQYNIGGSKQPTERSNDVRMNRDPNCRGNSSVTVGEQGNVGGTGRVEQRRTVRHNQSGGAPSPVGVNGPTVQIRVNPRVDVYNPAEKLER